MKNIFVFAIVFILPGFSQANFSKIDIGSFQLRPGNHRSANGVCYIPTLTRQQHQMFGEIRSLHIAGTKKIKARLEKQTQSYEKVLKDSDIKSQGFADEISRKLFKTQYNLSKEKTAFFHAVVYRILIKKQREHLFDCL